MTPSLFVKSKAHHLGDAPLGQHRLTYEGKYLDDGDTLGDHCIQRDTTLLVILCRGEPTSADAPLGNVSTLNVEAFDTTHVKAKLFDKAGMDLAEGQTPAMYKLVKNFTIAGTQHDDRRSLGVDGRPLVDHNIQKESAVLPVNSFTELMVCLLYPSDAAAELLCVAPGARCIITS